MYNSFKQRRVFKRDVFIEDIMTEQIILNAETRERTGTNKAREIRNIDGMVPAIVYGDDKETLNLSLIHI